ncbi:di-heme oxidoredictase family protein [Vibrio natriegens]|uniref:di-heme oxidoredictase family protein n=1 Tax=Vibrio natriegens TaxID=691 RepID=UPI003B5C60D7
MMKKSLLFLCSIWLFGCDGSSSQSEDQPAYVELGPAGGVATVSYDANNGFLQFIPELDLQDYHGASQGRELFIATWLPAPGSRELLDGFGPLAITDSCTGCHETSARAESLKSDGSTGDGILFRLADKNGAVDPFLGGQLQTFSADGSPEGFVTWTKGSSDEILFHLNDAMNPLAEGVSLGPRLSPQLIGMGLLDLVPESVILDYQDIEDSNSDGISGRAHQLETCIGRFGWKGVHCTLESQVAGAFHQDMGLTSSYNPAEPCTEQQEVCELMPSGGSPEVSDASLEAINDFLTILAVPERRNGSSIAFQQGRKLFMDVGCNACHRESLTTGEVTRFPILSNQTFYPYTDLLLHDMGADLSDGVKEGSAEPAEWKTPPLWGLGLIEGDGQSRFLHDGRAEDLQSAILWHGGEAQSAKQAFVELTEEDKQLLLDFLRSI